MIPTAILGAALMLGAVHFDPWGRSKVAAALFLIGAAGFIWALAAHPA